MSLVIKYGEPWVILPESRYDITDRKIDSYMDEDFSLFMRVKVFPDKIPMGEEGFVFARSGKHSGVSFNRFRDGNGDEHINLLFTYWFADIPKRENNPPYESNLFVQIIHPLTREELNDFLEIAVINDDLNKKSFSLYVNGKLVNEKEYTEEKQSYKFGEMGGGGFYQFGNGNFQVPDIAMYCECEFDLIFLYKKIVSYEEMKEFAENYTNYLETFLEELKVFKISLDNRNDLAFFLDFKNQNRYKVWELTHNGNYLSKATLENLYF